MTRGGGYAGEVRDLRNDSEAAWLAMQTEFDAKKATGVYGLQTSWAVDEVAGNDNAVGTSVAPLKSVTQLKERLSGTLIAQNTLIQFVGNVTTPLDLVNTIIAPGVTLTIQGTTTTTATGTISGVTALGPASGYPWQVDMTGIDWTTVAERRFVTNTGKTFWVSEVVSATRVIVSAGSLVAGTISAPVNAETITVHALSTVPLSNLATTGGFVSAGNIFGLALQDLRFTGGNTHPLFAASTRAKLYGCQIDMPSNGGLSLNGQNWQLISCRIQGSSTNQVQATGISGFTACLFDGSATFQYRTPVRCTKSSIVYNVAKLDIRNSLDVQGGGMHLRNIVGDALTIGAGAILVAPTTTSVISGAGNSAGFGIVVQSGAQYLYQASSKPTLTNATADTKIGGTNTPYGSVPFVNTGNNAQMVVLV